jgi:hypothetical protein
MNFERLTDAEIEKVLAYVPTRAYLQLRDSDAVLAGGLIRDVIAGVEPRDVDIFCHSEAQAADLAAGSAVFVRHTTFAYTVAPDSFGSLPVQFVYYKDFQDARDLITQFDFRACCAGIYYDKVVGRWDGGAIEGFRADCQAKALRFMSQDKDRDKLTALRRALNFAAKGWTIHNEEVCKIVTHFEPALNVERVRGSLKPAYGRR